MLKRLWLGLVLLAAVQTVFGQDCDSIVSDGANLLGSKIGAVEEAAKTINAQGGDAKVITVGSLSTTPEVYFGNQVTRCRSWQSTDGGIKNNLIVFFVSTSPRKLAIFFGREMSSILAGKAGAIKAQYMMPAFKDGDFARGFIAGETQAGMWIHASNEAALHPTQTTTTVQNQATDLGGLWVAIYWALGIGAVFFIIWLIMYLHGNSKKDNEAIAAAQLDAQQTSARVADLLQRMSDDLTERKALKEDVDGKIRSVSLVSEQYARMGRNESTNAGTNGLSAAQYSKIGTQYQLLMEQLYAVDRPPVAKANPSPKWSASQSNRSNTTRTGQSNPYTPPPAPTPAPQPTHTHTTVYVDNSPAYVPIPVIVNEPVYRDPEPSYSSSRRSRDDDSDSGSSSSYSSGSSSSSSYDSGSSSDYSSSSSDRSSFDSGSSSDF